MITYERALQEVLDNTRILPAKKTSVEESAGMILKEDVRAKIDMPPFDKSLMDGYAVNALDTAKVPARLKCLGLIQAGKSFRGRIQRGECVKIMTGAPIPKNTNSVLIIENTRRYGDRVEAMRPLKARKNISFQGEYFKRGQKIAQEGKKIFLSDIAVLATAGRQFVKATAKPRVAILNTGAELVSFGAKLKKNKIYNSIGPILDALLKSDGIEAEHLGIVKDDPAALRKAIKKGLVFDVLLISGGVSVGDYDFVPEVLAGLAVKKIFHKVNIKPGKPLFFGVKDKTIVFGIPGNPVPNFLAYFTFIRPAICKMMGYKEYRPAFREGIIAEQFRTKPGRKQFILVRILKKAGGYYLFPVAGHGSADTAALAKADGFMLVSGNLSMVRKGAKIKFITWKTI